MIAPEIQHVGHPNIAISSLTYAIHYIVPDFRLSLRLWSTAITTMVVMFLGTT